MSGHKPKIVWLSLATAVLAAIASGAGIFWQTSGMDYLFPTLRGQNAQMYGQGLYQYDTIFSAGGYKGTDAVVLFLGVPILVILALLYRHGSFKAGLLLTSILTFFLYVYASMALGAAYNPLFIIYVAVFSMSFFSLVLVFRTLDLEQVPRNVIERLPRRFPAYLLFASGLVTLIVWLSPIFASLVSGATPDRLDSYTTLMTYALDLAIITPATFASGSMILKRLSMGYMSAFALFGIIIMLAPGIAASTVSQIRVGVSFTPGEVIGPVAGFVILGLLSAWALFGILRGLPEAAERSPGESRIAAGQR